MGRSMNSQLIARVDLLFIELSIQNNRDKTKKEQINRSSRQMNKRTERAYGGDWQLAIEI